MYVLIDECCGKALVSVAEAESHVAQRTIEILALGKGATDRAIFEFAATHQAVVVTVNHSDFLNLTNTLFKNIGLILLPTARGTELAKLFKTILPEAASIFENNPTATLLIGYDGSIQVAS